MDRNFQGTLFDSRMPAAVNHWGGFQGQNPEELKHLLFRLSFELESTRLAAKDEIRRYEEYSRQLVNLLNVTCQERDEAREQCQKLQEKLLQRGLSDPHSGLSNGQPDSPAGRSLKGDSSVTECDSISGTYKHHSFASSPGQSIFDTSSMQEPSKPNIDDSSAVELLQNPYFDFPDDYQQSALPVGCNTDTYLTDALNNVEPQTVFHGNTSFTGCSVQSQNQTSLQSSVPIKSCGSDVRCQKKEIPNLQNHISDKATNAKQEQQQVTEPNSHVKKESQDRDESQKQPQQIQREGSVAREKVCKSNDEEENEPLLLPSDAVNTSEMNPVVSESLLPNSGVLSCKTMGKGPSIPNPGCQQMGSTKMNLPLSHCANLASNGSQLKGPKDQPSNMVPLHLPEPPEADPQVIIKSLPERGKLLEAVMKAGPLLQTLLLAGPLPQWRHPPPPLESFEIPLVSMPNSTVVNPIANPPLMNAASRNGVPPVQSPASGYAQNNLSQAQVVSLLQMPPSNNLAPKNKRPFVSSGGNHFVHELGPPTKLAKAL
eukprot:TRINITY_DN5460_c0_g1_i1.p1 TRINITY_DN5460_c0_g1~~TRINITY_DN5460_c0_g1_i1.p1  ORF type:complete len:542 (-),score=124.24 TRINITY_DN5460_c0_g1_i1:59-1684(-)